MPVTIRIRGYCYNKVGGQTTGGRGGKEGGVEKERGEEEGRRPQSLEGLDYWGWRGLNLRSMEQRGTFRCNACDLSPYVH